MTAVGDPVQSIYSWRGASASNLPRFVTDFPRPTGAPAPTPAAADQLPQPGRRCSTLANEVSASIRTGPDAPVRGRRAAAGPTARRAARSGTACSRRSPTRTPGSPDRSPSGGGAAMDGTGTRRRRRRRCCCAAAATWPRPPTRCGRPGCRSRWSVSADCWTSRRSPTWSPPCGCWSIPRPARRRSGCSPAPAGSSGSPIWRRWRSAPGSWSGQAGRRAGSRSAAAGTRSGQRSAQALSGEDIDAWCLVDAISDPGPAQRPIRRKVTGGWPGSPPTCAGSGRGWVSRCPT